MVVRIVTMLVGVAALVAALAFASAGSAQSPGANADIYFTAFDASVGAPNHLYAVHPDGSGLTQLTFGKADDQWVRVGPGAAPILLSRDTHEQCGHLYWAQGVDLFTVDVNGSGLERLTDNCPISDATPAWSPSAGHIVFSRFGDLWSMRPDGTDLARLTCTGTPTVAPADYAPDWSPDGSRIAFDRLGDVYMMRADGGDQRLVAPGANPSFSPDGRLLAYAGAAPGDAQGIDTVSPDGGVPVRLTTGYDLEPVWSPDGTEIAFIHIASVDVPQSFEVEMMKRDGSDVRVVESSVNAESLDWAGSSESSGSREPDVTAGETACAESAPSPASSPALAPAPSPAPIPATPAPTTVRAGEVMPPDRLIVAQVRFQPVVLRSRRPFSLTVLVRDRARRTVSGAAVQALPFVGYARTSAIGRTAADGRVTLRIVPTRRLPLANRRLVLEVRIRRPADSWTGAASGRRLVSVRTAPR